MPANITYNVNTLSDAANLPAGMITLRQAITNANTAAVGDNVTITFKTNANAALTGTILLESVLPDISKNVKILGSGENNLLIIRDQAAAKFGIFTIDQPATVTIQDVSIAGGDNPNVGGAVFNLGTLTLLNDIVFDNKAAFGGALDNNAGATATLTNVAFNNNTATCGGGISNAGTLGLNNSFINANYATDSSGGGIYNVSTGILNISATSTAKRKYLIGIRLLMAWPGRVEPLHRLGHCLVEVIDEPHHPLFQFFQRREARSSQ